MKRDMLFLGMDIVKQLDWLKEESEKVTGVVFNKEQEYGYECAKNMLHTILIEMLDEQETCVVHINGLDGQIEFFKSDLFKYFDKNGFTLPEVN
ncbi:hypothetical protein SAMN02746066_04661 [Anaerosporobacter mobilis DSM 15930]|uniref:Uncharacterized protein n=1 Tax=Anaerosporobacter mobilis DSM 15930 TaxID=1120996 RepID=A0A1M7NQG0_9FIRM|nr:hypothetical protein [Anaerosporobacter mobilis]SHN06087.1 hypothetical protein SAMN02746066_04661 [Anaerosporobacter mobilis DSM 15930]